MRARHGGRHAHVVARLPPHCYVHQGLGFGTFVVGLVAGTQFVATLISRLWAGRYADVHGPKRAVLAGLSFAGAAGAAYLASAHFATYPIASVTILLVGRALLGVMESFVITGALTWGVTLVGPQNTGTVMSSVGTALYTAFAVGALLGTGLYTSYGLAVLRMYFSLFCGRSDALAYSSLRFELTRREVWTFVALVIALIDVPGTLGHEHFNGLTDQIPRAESQTVSLFGNLPARSSRSGRR